MKKVRNAIKGALEHHLNYGSMSTGSQTSSIGGDARIQYETKSPEKLEDWIERVLTLVKNQDEY